MRLFKLSTSIKKQASTKVEKQSSPLLSFLPPEYYGSGISVSMIDFERNGTSPPFKSTFFEVLPGFTTPVDQHEVQECWMVLKGKGVLTFEDSEILIKEHDIVHFPSGKKHSVQNNNSEPLLLCSIYW